LRFRRTALTDGAALASGAAARDTTRGSERARFGWRAALRLTAGLGTWTRRWGRGTATGATAIVTGWTAAGSPAGSTPGSARRAFGTFVTISGRQR